MIDDGLCLVEPVPFLAILDELRSIEVGEEETVIHFENTGDHVFRTVAMNAEHPADLEPSVHGHSIGWWEGDTLVIDTVGFNDRTWFDFLGNPHSTELHTIERYTRIDYNTLENITTVIDPAAYTQPFTIRFTARLQPPDWDIMEYVCCLLYTSPSPRDS